MAAVEAWKVARSSAQREQDRTIWGGAATEQRCSQLLGHEADRTLARRESALTMTRLKDAHRRIMLA